MWIFFQKSDKILDIRIKNMKLKTRRIIALTFIIAFLITAPILILYTAGYRYNFKKNELKKTGALFLETEPKGADVYLNDIQRKETTPAHITNVFPNTYKIRLEKQGYYNWEKELEIKASQTTFSEDIILFKNSSPISIETGEEVLELYQTDDCIMAVFTEKVRSQNDISFNCLDDDNKFEIISTNKRDTDILSWSPSKNKFLIINGDKSGYQILSSNNTYSQTLNLPLTTNRIKWDLKNEHLIYYSIDNQIWQINLLGSQPVYSLVHDFGNQQIMNFRTAGDKLYFISSGANGNFLNLSDIKKPDANIKSIELPSANFVIDSLIDGHLILLDNKKSNIYILTENLSQTKIKQDGGSKYSYLEEQKLLIIYNDYEIFMFDLKEEVPQSNLIIRYSTTINKVDWFNDNYLIALHDGKIKVIELDNRENHNIWELDSGNETVYNFILDKSKENIYYLSKNKLWELNIQ